MFFIRVIYSCLLFISFIHVMYSCYLFMLFVHVFIHVINQLGNDDYPYHIKARIVLLYSVLSSRIIYLLLFTPKRRCWDLRN